MSELGLQLSVPWLRRSLSGHIGSELAAVRGRSADVAILVGILLPALSLYFVY